MTSSDTCDVYLHCNCSAFHEAFTKGFDSCRLITTDIPPTKHQRTVAANIKEPPLLPTGTRTFPVQMTFRRQNIKELLPQTSKSRHCYRPEQGHFRFRWHSVTYVVCIKGHVFTPHYSRVDITSHTTSTLNSHHGPTVLRLNTSLQSHHYSHISTYTCLHRSTESPRYKSKLFFLFIVILDIFSQKKNCSSFHPIVTKAFFFWYFHILLLYFRKYDSYGLIGCF